MGLLTGAQVGIRPAVWVASGANPFEVQIGLSQEAERLGFDGVFFGDRMLSSAGDRSGGIYNSTHTEALITFAAVAAHTQTVQIGSLVLVVPFRHPIQLAKSIASLDLFSGGRFIFGAGGGWNEAEFESLGLSKKEAGARLEEGLEAIRKLWTEDDVTYDGKHYHFKDVSIEPKSSREGGPPIWLGSFSPTGGTVWDDGRLDPNAKKGLERVGRLADGWVPLLYSTRWKKSIEPGLLREAWDTAHDIAIKRTPARRLGFEFSHWFYVIENAEDERAATEALGAFFPGTLDEARSTYLVGAAEEIVEKILLITSEMEETDWYIFSMLGPSPRQMELLAYNVLPLLEQAKTRVEHGSGMK